MLDDTFRGWKQRAERISFRHQTFICRYGTHGFGIFQHFLSRATNQCGDEYGGSIEDRSRFVNEVIAGMRDAVGDTVKVAFGTEAGFFAGIGIPAVVCGPGEMEAQGHKAGNIWRWCNWQLAT